LGSRPSLDDALTQARSNLGLDPDLVVEGVPPTPSIDWYAVANLGSGTDDDGSEHPLFASCVLWRPAWDHEALVQLRSRLGTRRLVAVEPVAGLGPWRLIQWVLTPWWRHRLGTDFNRDLPRELRVAGFTIDTVDRFTVGSMPIRTYAYLELSAPAAPD
jgi:hypothetical protein